MGVKCLAKHMGIAVTVIVDIHSSWEGLQGNHWAREGRETGRTDTGSFKEEATVGGGWLAFGGLDTHSV